jgi:hypothetical protein
MTLKSRFKKIFLVGPGFELRAFVFVKQVLYHLNHTSGTFCSGYFGDGVSRTRLALNRAPSDLSLPSG